MSELKWKVGHSIVAKGKDREYGLWSAPTKDGGKKWFASYRLPPRLGWEAIGTADTAVGAGKIAQDFEDALHRPAVPQPEEPRP